MKNIRYEFIPVKSILSPIPVESKPYTKDQSLRELETTDVKGISLPTAIGKLFPVKQVYFSQKSADTLRISRKLEGPFGPDPDTLIDFLFKDFTRAVEEVKTAFGLRNVYIDQGSSVISFDEGAENRERVLRGEFPEGICLNAWEFHKLYLLSVEGKRNNGWFTSLFLDSENVFTLFVPEKTPLRKIFSLIPQIEDFLAKNHDSRPYHPVSGKVFGENDTVGYETALICFTGSGYCLSPLVQSIFSFPYFNQRIGMKKEAACKRREAPCNNCLACVRYCPAGLYPHYLYHIIERGSQEEAGSLNLYACIQCGICSFVCPVNLPLSRVITEVVKSG